MPQKIAKRQPPGRRPFINVELNMPEARRTLECFARDRASALEAFAAEIRDIAADALNQLLNAEMNLFLGEPEQRGNKRNGFHRTREYHLKGLGGLRICVPRDRLARFDSIVLPSYERMDPKLRQDLALLHLAGISNRTLAGISTRLLGIEVSKDTVSSSLGDLRPAAEAWLTRPLSGSYWALYVDGTNFRVQRRGSTELEPMLAVLGVDEEKHRSILAIEPGTRDNVDCWRSVFRSLKLRGLDASSVRVGVMDGLPGLEKLFTEEFPNAVTARCWLHALRNAQEKTPARLRLPFKELAQKVMYATSEDRARTAFARLKEAMNGEAQRAVGCLEKDLDALVVHYRFERRFWVALKTTNAIERLHRELKRRTKSMDALGESNLMVVVAFVALRLEAGWSRNRVDSQATEKLTARGRLTQTTDMDDVAETLVS